ncbi:unnamed protein product [Meganyctiphanes norvegica]|uniref:Uncharacterized protein n=1 Tax=Meganyctiphanes norvegica TaxID=48144 RepID=A0AAV2PWG6_MEGNR
MQQFFNNAVMAIILTSPWLHMAQSLPISSIFKVHSINDNDNKADVTGTDVTDAEAWSSLTIINSDQKPQRSTISTGFRTSFQVIDLGNPWSYISEKQPIPDNTLEKFTPPEPTTKELRELKYWKDSRIEVPPPHILTIIKVKPYFDFFDHAKAMLALQHRRKLADLPLHRLKSSRPNFPFYDEN